MKTREIFGFGYAFPRCNPLHERAESAFLIFGLQEHVLLCSAGFLQLRCEVPFEEQDDK